MSISLTLVNYILLVLIAMYIIQGVHKGFLMSLSATGGMAVSWLIASSVTPMLSAQIAKGSTYSFLLYMTDVSQRVQDVDLARTSVASLSAQQIQGIVEYANLPVPFGDALHSNMTNLVFSARDITTVADYMNYTVANITVNIISFLIIYVLARVFITLILSSMYYASPFPALKSFDGTVGGVLGGVRGFFALYAVVMILPVIILFISLPVFTQAVNQSVLLTFFYRTNFLYAFISGVV